MAINKEELYSMIERLGNEDKKTVYDFIEFLNERSNKPESWKEIDELDSDKEPLTKEELQQLESEEGFIAGEDGKNEYKIQTDLP